MNIFRISVNRLQTAADCGLQRKDCSCGTYQNAFFKFNKNLPLHAAAFLGGVIFSDKIDNVKEDFAKY